MKAQPRRSISIREQVIAEGNAFLRARTQRHGPSDSVPLHETVVSETAPRKLLIESKISINIFKYSCPLHHSQTLIPILYGRKGRSDLTVRLRQIHAVNARRTSSWRHGFEAPRSSESAGKICTGVQGRVGIHFDPRKNRLGRVGSGRVERGPWVVGWTAACRLAAAKEPEMLMFNSTRMPRTM